VRLGWLWVPPSPFGVPAALRAFRARTVPRAEARGRPPLDFRPLQSSSPGPRAVPPVSRHVERRFLSWTFFALRHSPRPADPSSTADPSAAAYRVRGLTTPCATSTTGPPGACAPERPWASPFKGFSSCAIGTPLGAHALLTLPPASQPPRGEAKHSQPASGLSSRDEFVLSPASEDPGRRSLLGVHPSRACSRSTRRSLSSRRLPSRPSAA
jgi:hypothetical protein